jgi:hypothetical protein
MSDIYAQYKEIILQQLDSANGPLHHTSSGLTRIMLKTRLEKLIGIDAGELAASKIDIMVDDDLFEDVAFISAVVDKFAQTIEHQYELARYHFPNNTIDCFLNLISGTSLTLVPPQ